MIEESFRYSVFNVTLLFSSIRIFRPFKYKMTRRKHSVPFFSISSWNKLYVVVYKRV